MDDNKIIGYIKYDGKLVVDGMMDARQQAEALLGIDAAIRHFIKKQAPEIGRLEFDIPVKVRSGSWEALIPDTVAGWLTTGLGVVATAYFTKGAQKMAENDFADYGLKDLFRNSLQAILWFVKIGKHMNDLSIKVFEGAKYIDDNQLVGIRNGDGEFLYVPKHILDLYISASPRILIKLARLVEENRKLIIGVSTEQGFEEVEIGELDRDIFTQSANSSVFIDKTVMPELVHGEYVELDGEVTRENKTANSMGFKYNDHILTCYPDNGSIVPYKPVLFLKCKLYGYVNRHDENGRISEKKPKISFVRLEPLESNDQDDLFANESKI